MEIGKDLRSLERYAQIGGQEEWEKNEKYIEKWRIIWIDQEVWVTN